MSLLDSVRSTMRDVVASASGLCDAGWVRAITSAPTVQTSRSYGPWQATFGLFQAHGEIDTPDPKTGRLVRQDRASLRTSDVIVLPPGSQWSADKITLWAIDGIVSGGGGTVRYALMRETTERGQSSRGGGV